MRHLVALAFVIGTAHIWTATPVAPVITKTQCIAVKRVHHHVVCTKRAPVTCTAHVCVG